jgi:hypothetical protein
VSGPPSRFFTSTVFGHELRLAENQLGAARLISIEMNVDEAVNHLPLASLNARHADRGAAGPVRERRAAGPPRRRRTESTVGQILSVDPGAFCRPAQPAELRRPAAPSDHCGGGNGRTAMVRISL